MALTRKQLAFVEAFSGNAQEAARLAGYSGTPHALAVVGSRLLRHPAVRSAMEAREAPASQARIASRAERQAFWTRVMLDEKARTADRLKASELLGRSEADFVERLQHELGGSFADLLKEARKRAAR